MTDLWKFGSWKFDGNSTNFANLLMNEKIEKWLNNHESDGYRLYDFSINTDRISIFMRRMKVHKHKHKIHYRSVEDKLNEFEIQGPRGKPGP